MPRYYIQAEAFNLDHMVYDTHDISTIRGGSFLLLDAVKRLQNAFEGRLKPIATAASKGLFYYDDPGSLEAQRAGIVRDVLRFLHDATGGHATFLVAVEEDLQEDFLLVLNRLEAEVRRQQWRMPTVMVPQFAPTDQECYLDGWRPGMETYPLDREYKISAATHFRRQRGRELKHTLFPELLGEVADEDDLCAKDLSELATDPSKGILSSKIAFIHVDGNSFGRIRSALCTSPTTRKKFDDLIQERRLSFLRDLRTRAYAEPDFYVRTRSGRDVLRLEMLLWGGDEFTLIVPAWKGLEVLESFYRIVDGLEFDGVPMTHRAVVIFCHHSAPILQIRQLADELLDVTKSNIKARFKAALETDPSFASLPKEDRILQAEQLSNPEYGNAARYLVLESFDMLRGSLDQFFLRYYGISDTSSLLLYGRRLAELRDHLHQICSSAPKGCAVEIAHSISKGDTIRADKLNKALRDSISPDQRYALDVLTKDNDAGWYLLADLWDYAEEWKA